MKSVLITSTILILLIAALRPLLRGRIDPRIQYALWLLAALRLLIPWESVPSPYSALALLNRAEERTHLAQSIGEAAVPIPAMSYEDAYDQALLEYHQDRPVTASFTDLAEVERRAHELQSRTPTLSELAEQYARPLWLGGAVAMGLWFLLVNFRLRRKLRRALPVEADCPLPVCVTPELPSPCLCGLFRPKIYVTPAALADPDRTRHVLTHELTHHRHKDHWWALVRCLCLCVYWFDPLVWWAAALSRQDCELACDEGAIRRLGEGERIPYGRTLVAMIAAGRNSLLQTATTMTGGKRRVRERVALIARRPRTVIALALALVIVVGLAVGCTFTGAPEESPAPSLNLSEDTLQERLMDIPEDLREQVAYNLISDDPSHLADYWFNIPRGEDGWTAMEIRGGYLMSVYRFSWEEYMTDLSLTTAGRNLFARGDDAYYVIAWSDDPVDYSPAPDAPDPYQLEALHSAYEAIRAYAMEQVLATEGVEPFGLEQALTADTLQERLNVVPEYLQGTVNASASETKWAVNDIALVSYWWDVPAEWESERFPWLLDVHREERRFIDAHGWADDNDDQIREIIAQDEEFYYVMERPVDTRFQAEDSQPFTAAYQAIRDYAERQVLLTLGVESYTPAGQDAPESNPVQTAVNLLMAAPSVELQLNSALPELPKHYSSYVWSTVPGQDFNANYLKDLPTVFSWEEFDWGTTEEPRFPDPPTDNSDLSVTIPPGYAARIRVWEDSDLVYVHDSENGTSWYRARYTHNTARAFSVFEYLRRFWFDPLELDCLRSSAITIADRGRSHQEIAREWAEGYEGALYRTAPDSSYACTYVEITDVTADLPDWAEGDGLSDFAAAHGLPAGGFGTDWFGFTYRAVIVPVDQTTAAPFWAGNTEEYNGPGAPEGALTYSRVGILHRTSQGWVCEGSGTGW